MKGISADTSLRDVFRPLLFDFIDRDHVLVVLADRERFISHKMRNLINKLPKDKTITDPIITRLMATYYALGIETGQGLATTMIQKYEASYMSMIKLLNDDLQACLVYLKYLYGHRRSIRTINLI